MASMIFYWPQEPISTIFKKPVTDGLTDRRTDGRTDIASYRDAWMHLKRKPTNLSQRSAEGEAEKRDERDEAGEKGVTEDAPPKRSGNGRTRRERLLDDDEQQRTPQLRDEQEVNDVKDWRRPKQGENVL